MSKRKGVSAEEKKTRMLQLFYEKKEFFQLKELEKIAPKEKGIIAPSVKDVVQSLVDDGLVDSDKIGTSTYFWAYPSKAKHQKKRKLEEVTDKLEESKTKLQRVHESLISSKIGRESSKARNDILDRIEDLELDQRDLLRKIQEFKENDPEVLEQMEKEAEIAKEAANRWTDNIYAIKTWCRNKFNIEEQTLNKQFDVPSDLDYLD